MEDLIDDLLILAREGDAIAETESIELTELLERCWSFVPTEQGTLDVKSDLVIRGEWSRVQQLFENIFRNAVEHGGDDVTVRVGALEDGTGLYIEDDDPGFPKGTTEQIFEDGYSTSKRGTGFGLTIVDQIVEAHGWTITAKEGTDGGARFEITGIRFQN